MELHDYLGHGHRVLSSATAGGLPDILAHAADLAASRELPGLDAAHIAELKLAGNKDGELYRLLLVAQCNALSAAMPFLFERIDDETELLLPDNVYGPSKELARTLLADWGIGSERIQAVRDSVEYTIFTPGSDAGLTVSILSSFQAPQLNWDDEAENEALRNTEA